MIFEEFETIQIDKRTLKLKKEENGEETKYIFPTLYQRTKLNQLSYWKIHVIDDEIHKFSGIIDGKEKTYGITKGKGKNIGKKNEKTAQIDALFKASGLWKKNLDKGYVMGDEIDTENDLDESWECIDEESTDKPYEYTICKTKDLNLPFPTKKTMPMLAKLFENESHKLKYPVFVSRKLDGGRCLVKLYTKDGNVMVNMTTRNGKQIYFFDKIRKEIANTLISFGKPELILDGEMYTHDVPFKDLIGVFKTKLDKKRKKDIEEKICFHLFDIVDEKMGYKDRIELATKIFSECKRIKVVGYDVVKDEKEIQKFHDKYTSEGYEGLMVRNPKGKYRCKYRSDDLLKYKMFEDKEFKITDILQSEDGGEIGCAIYELKTKEGNKFTARPRGSLEYRREIYENREEYIGKMLTVRYQKTGMKDDIPRFPVGICIRDYE